MTWYKKFNVAYDILNEQWGRGFIKNRIINAYMNNGEVIDDKELRENDGQLQIYEIKGNNRIEYIINVSRKITDISDICVMHNKSSTEGLSEIARIKMDFQKRTGFKLISIV